MKPPQISLAALLAIGSALFSDLAFGAAESGRLDYNRDIRPILSDNCFACHGPDKDKRESGLRLDIREEALKPAKSEDLAIVPGKPEESQMIERIFSDDKDDQMPPPDAHKTLSAAQKETLKRWIAEGAEYQAHWAFLPPQRAPLPKLGNAWWPRNAIDSFIAAVLEREKLAPTPEAPKEILLRRVSFDLTGLPPTTAEVDAFLADTAPDAFDRVVDRLLASPRFGEHMGKHWLDVARYGDTHGLHLDNERSMWPYRDWVIRAYNENLPFDQFTIWQLAGDLLPNATRDQQIASGFNRCNVTSSEGGSIVSELLFRYAVDRAETTSSVWMGLTAGCAVCHDHKFDPITAKDFYSLYAFFNSAADPGMDNNELLTPPVLKLPSPEQEVQRAALDQQLAAVRERRKEELAKVVYQDPALLDPLPPVEQREDLWLDDDFPEGAKPQSAGGPLTWVTAEEGQVKAGRRAIKRSGEGIIQDYVEGLPKPFRVPAQGKIFVHVWLDPANPPKAVMLQWHTNGWNHRANWGDKDAINYGENGKPSKLLAGDLPKLGEWVRLEVDVAALQLKAGTRFNGLAFTQYGGTVYWDQAGISYEENPAADPEHSQSAWEKMNQGKDPGDKVPREIRDIFRSVKLEDRKPEHQQKLREYYLSEVNLATRELMAPLLAEEQKLQGNRKALEDAIPATLVMADLPKKRESFLMKRGQYDQPGEKVVPGTPEFLPEHRSGPDVNRLDLAQWLVSPAHPLTARVTVNRFWQQFFGTGLVKTAGDLGSQGEPPTHPELLDWLAVEFRESGWDVKKLLRLIVTSATYRQDSHVTPAILERDPENRLLARGPRFRLDAEEIRDNALYLSGLMDLSIGGRGVRPYQPPDIWEPVGFGGSNTRSYKRDTGASLYRRSIYTFLKRTAPPPSMNTFDGPSRESSCLRRERSNTPLQALLLMNDEQHVEAARALAQRILTEGGVTPEDRFNFAFRTVTARRPLDQECAVLKEILEKTLARYAADADAAKQAIAVGESKPNAELNPTELAAYTVVASILLNLDETLNKN